MTQNTIRKIAAVTMALLMTVGAGTMPIFAEKTSSSTSASESTKEKNMKAALTAVKKRVSIPEKLTEFKYTTSTKYGAECYVFIWSDKDNKESLEVSYVKGLINGYSYNVTSTSSKDEVQRFAKLSDEELISSAKKHLKKLDPDIADKVKYSVNSIALLGNTAVISFDRLENGIAVDGNGGNITIDKDTGELYSMYLEWFWEGTSFQSPSSKLTSAEAKAKYKELTTLTPIYRIVNEYDEKGERTQNAVFLYTSDFSYEIDAFTGKKSTIWDDMSSDKGGSVYSYRYYGNSNAVGAVTEAADEADCEGGVSFTEAELREIQADQDLLKKDEITALLKKSKYIKLPDYAELDNANLYKDEDSYFYSMVYRGGDDVEVAEEDIPVGGSASANTSSVTVSNPYFYMYLTINAKTGEVVSFNKDISKSYDNTKAYPVSSNAKIAEAAAKSYYGDIFGEYKASENNSSADDYMIVNGKKYYNNNLRTYVYNRYVNGVIVEGDSIYIEVDKQGEVMGISSKYTDVKFPSAPTLDKDKAFTKLFKQIKLNHYYDGYYKKDGTVKTYLLYDISGYTLDGKYNVVDYNGDILPKEKEDDTAYTDIKGIPQETAITTLARYDITLETENGKFDPDGKLTDKDFAAVVYMATRSYVPYYVKNGNYNEDEKAVKLTKKEAAKVFVDVYGGSDYAKLKGIYRSPFNDVKSSDEYVGFIAIAKALGFASGDSKGNYSPDKVLTRAEAMQMIYDYIKGLS